MTREAAEGDARTTVPDAGTTVELAPRFAALIDLDREELACPHVGMGQLRDAGNVVWVDELQAFVVTHHADVEAVLTNAAVFGSGLLPPIGPMFARRMGSKIKEMRAASEAFDALWTDPGTGWTRVRCLLDADPPAHPRQRSVVSRVFTPRKVKALEGRIAAIVDELIDGFVTQSEVDLVEAFCSQLPIRLIAGELGIGTDRLATFRRWSDAFTTAIGNDRLSDEAVLRFAEARVEFSAHFGPLIEERRANPRDDILSGIATAVDDGGEPLDLAECLRLLQQLLVAGSHTTAYALAAGAVLLEARPDLVPQVMEDDARLEAFVEEVVRLTSPVQGLYRTARTTTTLSGTEIPEGSAVLVLYAAANRDDGVFPDPDAVDLDRSNPRSHVGFGKGAHFCLGAPLARAELGIAFRALLERVHPWRRLASEPVVPATSYMLHGPVRYVVELLRASGDR